MIDFDAGPVITGASSIDQMADDLLDQCLVHANGKEEKAVGAPTEAELAFLSQQ